MENTEQLAALIDSGIVW